LEKLDVLRYFTEEIQTEHFCVDVFSRLYKSNGRKREENEPKINFQIYFHLGIPSAILEE
jgi:hypothetical protein